MRKLTFVVVILVLLLTSPVLLQTAYGGIEANTSDGTVSGSDRFIDKGKARSVRKTQKSKSLSNHNTANHSPRILSTTEKVRNGNREIRRQQALINAAISRYQSQLRSHDACMQSDPGECSLADRPVFGDLGAIGTLVPGQSRPGGGAPPPPALTPQQVAYIAFARLHLDAPTPGIGPPPDINRWKVAAVGYPLWLWGEGKTNPAAVSDSVAGLFVSLDAHVSKIVFNMGDGSKVTCQGTGQKWRPGVAAGRPSPVCGHIYQKPSLPQGKYKVTATTHWSVAWTVTGTSGVIPFVQSSTVTLPVGELQVLVR